MKFTQIKAFEKHIESAMPDHLSDIYLIVDPEEHVQKKMADLLTSQGETVEAYEGDTLSLSILNQAFNAYSMFSEQKWIKITKVEKLSKEVQKKLIKQSQTLDPKTRLILCMSSMSKDFECFNKQGVILDLSKEKPWDRDKRLSFYVQEKLQRENMRISLALADQIVKKCASKVALIDSEVEKLLCMLHGKLEVSRLDLNIISPNFEYSIFKVGQALLDQQLKEAIHIAESENFPLIMLIYSLRSMVQRAYRLKDLKPVEVTQYFPSLRGTFLEKNLQLSRRHSKENLKKMLQTLFEVEVLLKNQAIREPLLSSLLLMKIGAYSEPISV